MVCSGFLRASRSSPDLCNGHLSMLPDFLQTFRDYGAVFVKQVEKEPGGRGIGSDLMLHSLGSRVMASIMDPTGENLGERKKNKNNRNQCVSAGGPSSQSAMTVCQMAAGQLGCRAISIIITHKAQHSQKVKGRPFQICQAETPRIPPNICVTVSMCDI